MDGFFLTARQLIRVPVHPLIWAVDAAEWLPWVHSSMSHVDRTNAGHTRVDLRERSD